MTFTQLTLLLPSYSIETFDLQCNEHDAEQLLSGWSALWHPRLLAGVRGIPRWLPATSPPEEPSGHLVVLPDCCESLLPEDWLKQAEAAGACVLRRPQHRGEVAAVALERLDDDNPSVDPDLACDFLALGFCYLQVELLTRKFRYMSNLDETSLRNSALAAAKAAIAGDAGAAQKHLQSAFDRLHEARECFYPTSARWIDLTLVAPSTLGAELKTELAGRSRCNLLVSGDAIERMAEREPATLDALKQALAENRAALIGGEYGEAPLPLLDPEAIEFQLRRGLACYEKHLGRRPIIFGRRRFGLTPILPAILRRTGFSGAFHCTLDDGRFPTGNQSRIQWEGIDGTTIEALGSLPLNAASAGSFLQLAGILNHTMSLDNASTVVFAHWPDRISPWYDDLRRVAAYGSVLGEFLTINDYFEQTASTGQRNRYPTDRYRPPYLNQDVAADRCDPISRWVRYFHRQRTVGAIAAMNTLAAGGGGENEERGTRNEELPIAVENSLIIGEQDYKSLDEQLSRELQKPLVGFANAIVGTTPPPKRGCLAVNPHSFSQPLCVPHSSFLVPPSCPAMGFAWIGPGGETPAAVERKKKWFGRRKPQVPPPLAEENVLRNEFFEIHFDSRTGAIRTISDYRSRDPRLAQQIALRSPRGGEPGSEGNYSTMAADQWTISSAGPTLGEIICRGRLLDHDGRRVAGFQQTTRVWRGCPMMEIEIELDIDRQPGSNPWDSYYAARFAWKDESAKLTRSVNMANVPTELKQFESPYFVDICRSKQHTTLLTGGLPYHRRFGPRKLDTLLVVQGETARSFRFGIGIDLPHPMASALGFMASPSVLSDWPSPPTPSGWLFHLDCRNVLATHWEPLRRLPSPFGRGAKGEGLDERDKSLDAAGPPFINVCTADASGMAGFRVRLLETDGRGVSLRLRCYRVVASARLIHPGDAPPTELAVAGDRIDIPIGPYQWLDVEARF